MRKVTKILLKLISTALLLLILLPLFLSLVLTLPTVQSKIVTALATTASDYLGTRVAVKSVDIGALGMVKIRGLYVEDYQRDTLIYVEKLNAHILRSGLLSRDIRLGYGELEGGELHLRQTADSVLNIKPIIDKLSNKDKKGQTRITLQDVRLTNSHVKIEQLTHRDPEYGVDYGDMDIQNIQANINNLTILGPDIEANISHFACREKSGFELFGMRGDLKLGNGSIVLTNTQLDSRYSQVTIPRIEIVGESWADYKDFIGKVTVDIQMRESTLSSDDVAFFAPKLKSWGLNISDLDIDASGTVDNLSIKLEQSHFEEESALAINATIVGLPDINTSEISARIVECRTSASDVERLVAGISGKELSAATMNKISQLQWINFSGGFEGKISDFLVDLKASTALGAVTSELKYLKKGAHPHVEGNIESYNFNIGRLLGNSNVGRLSIKSSFISNLGEVKEQSRAYGSIEKVELRGEEYTNITYNIAIADGDLNGRVRSRNKALDFDLVTRADLNGEIPDYDIMLRMNNIDFKALKLNERDSISSLKASLKIKGSGSSLENINGEMDVLRAVYHYNDKDISTNNFTIRSSSDQNQKIISLESDFADITFHAQQGLGESFAFLQNSLRNYLPALYNDTPTPPQGFVSKEVARASRSSNTPTSGGIMLTPQTRGRHSYSAITAEIKNLSALTDAISSEVQVADDSYINLLFNPSSEELSLSLRSQFVEFNSTLALDLNLDASNRGDSLTMLGSVKELLVGTGQFSNFLISGGARNDRINITAGYRDTLHNSSAHLGITTTINNSPSRGRYASLHLRPSYIQNEMERWSIDAQRIEVDTMGLTINGFKIQSRDQLLAVDGIVSRSTADTLNISMHKFDLAALTTFSGRLGYAVEGQSSGNIDISSAIVNMRVQADVNLDSVRVNNLPAPPLKVNARWDTQLNQASVTLNNRIKGDTLIRGYYIPSKVRYFARVDIDSLHLGLLDAPLKMIVNDTQGYAHANLTLMGERRQATLEGDITIDSLSTTIDYTKVRYTVPHARVVVKDNKLIGTNAPIIDPEGGRGTLNLTVDLQHLSNIAYDIKMLPQNMLVLNTTQKDNDLFYGKMYSTGVVDVTGNKRGVNMNITATTDANSEFFMPLSNKSTISSAQFIKFVSPTKVDTTDFLVRKKLMFEKKKVKSASNSSLNINMALHVTPDADFQLVIDPTVGDIIKGRGDGRINLRINPSANIFEMYGDYTITEGSYLFTLRNIVNKKFIIDPGSTIQWTGEPLDALLNIDAIYKLKTSLQPLISDESTRAVPVDCIIHLRDRLTQPTVSFDIELPTADPEQIATVANLLNDQEAISRQFFYLMLANSFIADTSSAGVASDLGVSTTAATGFELLTNQLSNWLSSSNYNIVIRYRPESELLGDELDLGFSKGLINNRLLVELEGNFTNDTQNLASEDQNSNASNFTGEAYITWLIDKSGALRLKGFTQTIDRYDENQGLQETGIGIYYKESFNDFWDLQQRVRNRFRSKRRKEELESRAKEKKEAEKEKETKNK